LHHADPLLPAQPLAPGESLAITDGFATVVRIETGEVCISEYGSFVDHLLCAGEGYAIDRPGRAIVAARTSARITIHAPIAGLPPRRVERCDEKRASIDLLYARSPMLNLIATVTR